MSELIALALLPALLLTAGLVLRAASGRFRDGASTLIDAVDAALPQTQCGQCGYPGCRPYAQALLAGAPLDLCPPGGAHTQETLVRLLGREAGNRLEDAAPLRAVIDEDRCIGCYLCVEACPVDAIVGARQWLHTVIEDRCTGCELCLAPCPVDCIEMVEVSEAAQPVPAEAPRAEEACIRCGRCREACPEALLPDQLWWGARSGATPTANDAALAACIECGLCNPVCPSELDLLGTFVKARQQRAAVATLEQEAERARGLFEERQARLARAAADAAARRSQRLRARGRQW